MPCTAQFPQLWTDCSGELTLTLFTISFTSKLKDGFGWFSSCKLAKSGGGAAGGPEAPLTRYKSIVNSTLWYGFKILWYNTTYNWAKLGGGAVGGYQGPRGAEVAR